MESQGPGQIESHAERASRSAGAPAAGRASVARAAGSRAERSKSLAPARVYPEPVERLIAEFAKLPGIGRRTAERLALHMLKSKAPDALLLARAVEDVKTQVRHCPVCFNLADGERCGICLAPERERSVVLVVEQPRDLISLEQTGSYKGLYHVLLGRLSPLDGVGPADLTIDELLGRLTDPAHNPGGVAIREVVLGLNPTVEGDGTGLYLTQQIRLLARRSDGGESSGNGGMGGGMGGGAIRVTRLARGLASGSTLELSNRAVLADAIVGRSVVD